MRPDKDMSDDFSYRRFHRRRKLLKISGLVLVLAGLFTIVDLMSEEPIPLTGARAVFVGSVLIIFGLTALYHGYKLPLEEALDLVHRRGRGITESEVVHDMRVNRATAKRIIEGLIRKGFLRRATDQSGYTEEVFEPVR
jgi:hypothetical protein